MDYSKIITIEPGKRSGKPCIRGLRVTVYDVLDYLASGMTHEEILSDFPYLTEEDIRACPSALEDLRKGGIKVNVKFVGFDTSKKLVEDVQAGKIDALVAQNPEKMGYLAVETLYKVVKKEKVPAVIDTGTVLVTKDKLANDAEVRKLVGL